MIRGLLMPEVFLDTSIVIRRMRRGGDGQKVRTYLSDKTLYTSTFVLMEFKRTILKGAISLYNILEKELTFDDAKTWADE